MTTYRLTDWPSPIPPGDEFVERGEIAVRTGRVADEVGDPGGQMPAVCANEQRVRGVGEPIGPNLETKTSGVGNGDGAHAESWSGDKYLSGVVLDRIEVETAKELVVRVKGDHRILVDDVRT
jgi:hypothetical protein